MSYPRHNKNEGSSYPQDPIQNRPPNNYFPSSHLGLRSNNPITLTKVETSLKNKSFQKYTVSCFPQAEANALSGSIVSQQSALPLSINGRFSQHPSNFINRQFPTNNLNIQPLKYDSDSHSKSFPPPSNSMDFSKPPPSIYNSRPPQPLQNGPSNSNMSPSLTYSDFSKSFKFQANDSQLIYQPPQQQMNFSQPPHAMRPTIINSIETAPPLLNYSSVQPFNESVHNDHLKNKLCDQDTCESEIEEKKRIGEQRLTTWLLKFDKKAKNIDRKKSKEKSQILNVNIINAYLCTLQNHSDLIKDMSNQVEKMESMITDSDKSSWQKECYIFEAMKVKHKELKDTEENMGFKHFQKKMTTLKVKRSRSKKSRYLKYQERLKAEEEREIKEKEISKWQQTLQSKMKEQILKKKRKQEMDQTLCAVRKKIDDANRLIETMKALEKLRLIRQDAAKKRGDSEVGESRESFEQKISDMTRLVQSQLEVYKEEEMLLRKAIKTEHDEISQREIKLKKKKLEEEQREKDKKLHKMLFGFSEDAYPLEPLFHYQLNYKQAQTSLGVFLQIRCKWDRYCVDPGHPHGSTIPQGWVLPSHPSNSVWGSSSI